MQEGLTLADIVELNEPDYDFKGSDDDDFLNEGTGKVDELIEQTANEIKKKEKKEKKQGEEKKVHKIRKQKQSVDRSQIVIKSSKKSLIEKSEAKDKKANPLADAFANIDLSQKEPAQVLSTPSYNQKEAPAPAPAAEKKSSVKLRTKRRHGTEDKK